VLGKMTIEIANAVCRFAIDIPTEVLLYRSFACAMSLAIHNFVGTNDWVLFSTRRRRRIGG
jgi:hypothetical protein